MKSLFLNRKLTIRALAGGFALALMFSFLGFDSICNNIECKVLRLHIRANSDSSADQQIKLAVKDKVFTLAGELTADCRSVEEAAGAVENNMDILVSAANEYLRDHGINYTATGRVEECSFGTRDYGSFTLPAGEYLALRIDLGEARGENWWCALYPALCSTGSVKHKGFTEQEEKLISSSGQVYEVRFKLYELYRRLADVLSG